MMALFVNIIKNEEEAYRIQNKLNNVTDLNTLTDWERYLFDNRNEITQSLGTPNITPRIFTRHLPPGYALVLCTDGVSDNLTDEEIKELVNSSREKGGINSAEVLTVKAQERSETDHLRAKRDDMTAIVVEIGEQPGEGLKVGDRVFVQQTDYRIEGGWEITHIDPKTGTATVSKGRKEMSLPLQDLVKTNRIQNARDPDKLYSVLRELRGLQGSQQSYDSDTLIRIIEGVLNGKLSIKVVPRTCGLRWKVWQLATQNKRGKK